MHVFAASPAHIMVAAFGRLHKGGRPPSAAAPFVDSFIEAREAANADTASPKWVVRQMGG